MSSADILDTRQAGPAAIRGGVLRVLGYVAGALLSVISAALLIRYLGASDFGRYTTIVSLVTIVGGVTEAGMTNIGVREFAVQSSGRTMLRNLLGIRLVLTVVGLAIAMGFSLAAGYDNEMVLGTAIAGSSLFLLVLQATYGVPLQVQLKLGWVTAIELVRQAATVVFILAGIAVGAGLVLLWAVPVPAGIAAVVFTIVGRWPRFDRAAWWRLIRLAVPYSVATAAALIYAYVVIVVLSLVSTEEEVGYFGAAFRVFIMLAAVPGLAAQAALPLLARAARDEQTRLSYAMQRMFDVALSFGVGMALITAVGAPIAIDIVAGPEFGPSVEVLRVLGPVLVFSTLLAVWGIGLLSMGRYRALMISNALGLAVAIVMTLLLAPSGGASAAAYANLVGEAVIAAGYGIGIMGRDRSMRVSLPTAPAVLAALAAALLTLLIPSIPALVDVIVVGVVYLVILVVAGGIPPDVREAFAARLRRGERKGEP
jgi:O-antigen/teichoic acid export membrane protein